MGGGASKEEGQQRAAAGGKGTPGESPATSSLTAGGGGSSNDFLSKGDMSSPTNNPGTPRIDGVRECIAYKPGMDGVFACSGKKCPNSFGTVWGTGPYAADSAICRAARHAKVLKGNGSAGKFAVAKAGTSGGNLGTSEVNNVVSCEWAAECDVVTITAASK